MQDKIIALLSKENKEHVQNYAAYIQRLILEKEKNSTKLKNAWIQGKAAEQFASLFLRVKADGLVFDGKHITLQSTGISYDYVAYKNKMLLAYPETKFDLDVVKEGDTFTASKDSGRIVYSHNIANPLTTASAESIVGAYCVIKNARGEFLTVLSKEDIDKHRKVAKTDFIWKAWFKEMVLKTVIKKACKYHYDDIFESINGEDNKQNDLEKVIDYDAEDDLFEAMKKDVIAKLTTYTVLKELQDYYKALATDFIKDDDVLEAYNAQKEVCKTSATK